MWVAAVLQPPAVTEGKGVRYLELLPVAGVFLSLARGTPV